MTKFLHAAFAAVITAVALCAMAGPAAAHVSPVEATAPAGGYTTVELQVPHGCEGQPTRVVAVQLRDDISSVKAQAIPGWTVTYDKAPLDTPIDLHGQEITDYVKSVTWTVDDDADALSDYQFMRFGISMKVPDLAGEQLVFPTVQNCVDGSESAWLDEDLEAEHPAPRVELVAADDGHGDPSAAAPATDTKADDDDDDSSDKGTRSLIAFLAALAITSTVLLVSTRRF